MGRFDFGRLFSDVFHPEADERVLVVTDTPREGQADTKGWADRRQMADEWQTALKALRPEAKFQVLPLVTYPATGVHNGELPLDSGEPLTLRVALAEATAVVAPTEFSTTAPLVAWSKEHEDFRAATLPGVARRTEQTALATDYSIVAERCAMLRVLLEPAVEARVLFSTGHVWTVDLRHRTALDDNGQLPRDKATRVINLPSGEAFQVPYEGEREEDPSGTEGQIPLALDDDLAVLTVEANRIVDVEGLHPEAQRLRVAFIEEPAQGNIAEFAFGCNPEAVVWGNVLEDEKAGFHWAYGRSEHLGGSVGPSAFSSPEKIVHQDIVYAKESPIQVSEVVLKAEDGAACMVIKEGDYVAFGIPKGEAS